MLKARVVKEVRASLTNADLTALAAFFSAALMRPDASAAVDADCHLHLHPHGNQWIGVAYADGGSLVGRHPSPRCRR